MLSAMKTKQGPPPPSGPRRLGAIHKRSVRVLYWGMEGLCVCDDQRLSLRESDTGVQAWRVTRKKWGKLFRGKKQCSSKVTDAVHATGFDMGDKFHLWTRERVEIETVQVPSQQVPNATDLKLKGKSLGHVRWSNDIARSPEGWCVEDSFVAGRPVKNSSEKGEESEGWFLN